MAIRPFMGSSKFFSMPKDQASIGFFHHDPEFVFLPEWKGLLVNGVRDLTYEELKLPYFSNDVFENTDYYESTFMCPFCSEHVIYVDDQQVVPLLWKLKLEPTQSRFENKPVELHNLFTCCNCNRYFASIRTWNGDAVFDNKLFMPSSLSDFALYTEPFETEEWLELFDNSINLVPIDAFADITNQSNELDDFPMSELVHLVHSLENGSCIIPDAAERFYPQTESMLLDAIAATSDGDLAKSFSLFNEIFHLQPYLNTGMFVSWGFALLFAKEFKYAQIVFRAGYSNQFRGMGKYDISNLLNIFSDPYDGLMDIDEFKSCARTNPFSASARNWVVTKIQNNISFSVYWKENYSLNDTELSEFYKYIGPDPIDALSEYVGFK